MLPSEFYLAMHNGKHGGFVGTTPDEIHTFTASAAHTCLVRSAFRSADSSILQESSTRELDIRENNASLLSELHTILGSLPPNVEFGGDLSIEWGSEDLVWKNQRRDGLTKASIEDDTKFQRAVGIVQELLRG